LVGEDGSAEAELTPTFSGLLASDLITVEETPAGTKTAGDHHNRDWIGGVPKWLVDKWNYKRPRPAFAGLGLNKEHLVPPTGFEPVLPA
jgi:hypothetical protein